MDGALLSRYIEVGLAISGIAILYVASRAFLSGDAWGEGAEYEVLDLPRPSVPPRGANVDPAAGGGGNPIGASPRSSAEKGQADERSVKPGAVGIEDRIVRIGFAIACTYLAITWFGPGSVAMRLFVVPVLYLGVTATVGADPVYRWLGVSTRLD